MKIQVVASGNIVEVEDQLAKQMVKRRPLAYKIVKVEPVKVETKKKTMKKKSKKKKSK